MPVLSDTERHEANTSREDEREVVIVQKRVLLADDNQAMLDIIKSILEREFVYKVSGFSIEKRCVRKDGREVWFRSSLSELQQGKKLLPLHIALVEDITDRKLAEKALAAKELDLREAQRLAGLGNWEWNPRTDSVVWSE